MIFPRKLTMSTKPKPVQQIACGQRARVAGISKRANPFKRGDVRWHQWVAGWMDAKQKEYHA